MTAFEILFAAGAAVAALILPWLAFVYRGKAHAAIAAALAGGFAGFTAITIYQEGLLGFMPNHTSSLWGVQVWYDLVIAIILALLFVIPRARAAGMRVAPWVLLCGLTGCIGLAAMVARLLWMENRMADARG